MRRQIPVGAQSLHNTVRFMICVLVSHRDHVCLVQLLTAIKMISSCELLRTEPQTTSTGMLRSPGPNLRRVTGTGRLGPLASRRQGLSGFRVGHLGHRRRGRKVDSAAVRVAGHAAVAVPAPPTVEALAAGAEPCEVGFRAW